MRPRLISRALLVLPATTLALTTGLASAQAAGTPGWRAVATVTVPSRNTELLGIAAAGPAAAWAAGGSAKPTGASIKPVLEEWNGTAWTPISLSGTLVSKMGPSPLLYTVSASSPGNVWAFTLNNGWLHGNGSTWTAGRIATPSLLFDTALATGTDSAWVFGTTFKGSTETPYAAYYTGSKGWKRTSVPGTGMVAAASAVTASNIWAVVVPEKAKDSDRLVHWSSGAWHTVASIPLSMSMSPLVSLLARSSSSVWVGGAATNSKKGTTEAIGHWNGHKWSVTGLKATASKAMYKITSIVPDGSGGLWALGTCSDSTCGDGASRLWHETGGSWSRPVEPKLATSGTLLTGLAATGKSVWASGAVRVGKNGANGLIALWGPTPH
jgi:hypothetical protein